MVACLQSARRGASRLRARPHAPSFSSGVPVFRSLLVVFASATLLSGCVAAPPTTAEWKNAEFGPEMFQSEAQKRVGAFLVEYLGSSVQPRYQWGALQPAWAASGRDGDGSRIYGYELQAKIAINGTEERDYRPYAFLLRSGEWVAAWRQRMSYTRFGPRSYMDRIK
jgi:hypothetical protein